MKLLTAGGSVLNAQCRVTWQSRGCEGWWWRLKPLIEEGEGTGQHPCCLKCEGRKQQAQRRLTWQDGRGKHPQCLTPFDMAKRRVRGVVTTFVEGKGGAASGLFEGRWRGERRRPGSPVVSISHVWLMTWQLGTIEETGDSINWMGSLLCWGFHLGVRMLAFGWRRCGLRIEFKWGAHIGLIPCFADDVVVGPYRQGSRVGCAGISEHGPHLLREGHMGEWGGRRWLA